ncbi:MAG TPA: hypothetical protein VFK68_04080 [Propionibacteriaceae bacterium]|nr:hypothetical protein [Propionibacteriaceae bacterium]
MSRRRVTMAASAVMLVVATVVVFLIFDSRSHSSSDTLRPLVITMAPAWVLYAFAWRYVWVKRAK